MDGRKKNKLLEPEGETKSNKPYSISFFIKGRGPDAGIACGEDSERYAFDEENERKEEEYKWKFGGYDPFG